ncbi:MAG: shikimate dehydrogenase [Clostridiales bacterium]|nr:shikimate dehydrogenase [Clostridiales bacterium]
MEYGLIGEKLGHSYSKLIHEKLADYSYDLCPLTKEEFPVFMTEKNFHAINVTIPYKKMVIPYLSEIDLKAKRIGAVNTIVNENGKLIGHNTDYDGFAYTLQKHNIEVTGKKVLVIGNGGAAQAIFAVLNDLHASEIITVKYKVEPGTVTYEEAARLHSDAYLIVNTSPIGMYPNADASPMDLSPYHELGAVVDIIYNPTVTKLMEQAISLNVLAVNGLEMLIAQAKYAVEYFLNKKIDDSVIEEIYKDFQK